MSWTTPTSDKEKAHIPLRTSQEKMPKIAQAFLEFMTTLVLRPSMGYGAETTCVGNGHEQISVFSGNWPCDFFALMVVIS